MSHRDKHRAAYAFVAFGDLLTQSGELKAGEIFTRLFPAGEWYIPRPSLVLRVGTSLLFYQSGLGFRAAATVVDITPAGPTNALGAVLSNSFARRLRLENMDEFDRPIALGPLAKELDFVLNKKWWGTALRGTPRAISAKDYLAIMRCAHAPETALSKG